MNRLTRRILQAMAMLGLVAGASGQAAAEIVAALSSCNPPSDQTRTMPSLRRDSEHLPPNLS